MLCGHTHGGQVWPFGYVVRIFYPLLAGRYDVSGMTAIVAEVRAPGVHVCASGAEGKSSA